jgi:hypothetical protein
MRQRRNRNNRVLEPPVPMLGPGKYSQARCFWAPQRVLRGFIQESCSPGLPPFSHETRAFDAAQDDSARRIVWRVEPIALIFSAE